MIIVYYCYVCCYKGERYGCTLNPGDSLKANESITSANGSYTFVYQADGNLVLYSPFMPLWASNTDGRPTGLCIMQGDGNIVIYDPASNALWASGTDQYSGSRLLVQDDGNVVIYQPEGKLTTAGYLDLILWTTKTAHAQGDDMQPGEMLDPDQSIVEILNDISKPWYAMHLIAILDKFLENQVVIIIIIVKPTNRSIIDYYCYAYYYFMMIRPGV